MSRTFCVKERLAIRHQAWWFLTMLVNAQGPVPRSKAWWAVMLQLFVRSTYRYRVVLPDTSDYMVCLPYLPYYGC